MRLVDLIMEKPDPEKGFKSLNFGTEISVDILINSKVKTFPIVYSVSQTI